MDDKTIIFGACEKAKWYLSKTYAFLKLKVIDYPYRSSRICSVCLYKNRKELTIIK